MRIGTRHLRHFDLPTLLVLAMLLTIGALLVASATADDGSEIARRQILWAGIGFVGAILVGLVDYRHFIARAYMLWASVAILLAVVLLTGPVISGARSWVRFAGFSLQPSEFAKLAVVVALARYTTEREPRPMGITSLIVPTLIAFVPFGLTALQPDLGTAATFLPLLVIVCWVVGLRRRTLLSLGAAGIAGAPLGYFMLLPYQRARLTTFLNPGADPLGSGYQIMQSKIAIGSGGFTGKGLFSGTQSQLDFLPAQHNDFIIGVLGEELGFVGVAFVLLLYLLLLLRVLRSARLARDRSGVYLATGVAALLAYHLAVNVGMVIGFAPITGIPLPLLSAGGSSTLSTCLAVGVAMSVHNKRFFV